MTSLSTVHLSASSIDSAHVIQNSSTCPEIPIHNPEMATKALVSTAIFLLVVGIPWHLL